MNWFIVEGDDRVKGEGLAVLERLLALQICHDIYDNLEDWKHILDSGD